MATLSFKTGSVPPRDNSFDILPKGWYQYVITESNVRAIDNGEMLELTFECQTQGFRGRKVWGRLCHKHTNAKTQLIAQQQLDELCRVLGIDDLRDTVQLHNKPFQGFTKIRLGEGINPKTGRKYDDSNEVTGFKAVGEAVPGNSAAPAPAGVTPAWQKPAQAPAQPAAAAPQEQPAQTPQAAAPAPAPASNAAPWLKKA